MFDGTYKLFRVRWGIVYFCFKRINIVLMVHELVINFPDIVKEAVSQVFQPLFGGEKKCWV